MSSEAPPPGEDAKRGRPPLASATAWVGLTLVAAIVGASGSAIFDWARNNPLRDPPPVESTLLSSSEISLDYVGLDAPLGYLFKDQLDPAALPESESNYDGELDFLARERGALPAEETRLSFELWGTQEFPAVLEDATPVVHCAEAVATGTFVAKQPTGGGFPARRLTLNLDTAALVRETDTTGSRWNFPLRVTDADQERFIVTARTRSGDCRWSLVVTYTLKGVRYKTTINNKGEPFVTTAVSPGVRRLGP